VSSDMYNYEDDSDSFPEDAGDEAIWGFFITDMWGNLRLEGRVDSYFTLTVVCRRMYANYPADNLFIENAATGAGVMFVPEAPLVATFVYTEGNIIRMVDQIYAPDEWMIWAHLTADGRFDPDALMVDFLGSGKALAAVHVTPNILLN
jgi:hypothetical protein